MVSVDPEAIRFLQPPSLRPKDQEEKAAADESPEEITSEDPDAEDSAEADPEAAADAEVVEETEDDGDKPKRSAFKKRSPSTPVSFEGMTPFHLPAYAAPFLFIPAYLEPSFSTCSVIYLRHPTARPGYSEIPTPWDADGEVVRLAWEWYSKRRMRIRSKSQLARMPENRQ